MKNLTLLLFLILFLTGMLNAQESQNRFLQIENNLEALKIDNPGLSEKLELSVSGASIQEFLRGVAVNNGINISVDPTLNIKVVNSFSSVSVADMLLFLAKQYNLDYQFTGNIISISAFQPTLPEVVRTDTTVINFNEETDLLTLDVKDENLENVAKKITQKTNTNVVLSPGIGNKIVRGYILNMKLEEALSNFAYGNELVVEKQADDIYLLKLKSVAESEAKNNMQPYGEFKSTGNLSTPVDGLSLNVAGINDISVYAEGVPIDKLLKTISSELEVNYYLQSKIDGATSIKAANYSYEGLLTQLFQGTPYTFKKENGIYLIGSRIGEGLRKTTVYPLQHRTVEKITEHIPTALSKDVEIKEFNDLNSLVLSGSAPIIDELSSFIQQIDQIVPVVAIEVIIVDYSKSRTIRTGLSAGIGEAPRTSGGTIIPTIGYGMGAGSVNSILRDLDFGSSVNLGQVTPNFYLELDALESDGLVNIRSTPKLATLNGHEANLSIGSTQYYVQETNNVIGTQNPQTIFTRQFQPVNADLSVSIKPFVSGDNQITLEITVDQSDFTDRIEPDAPPNSVSRSFSSILRVKNQEMIVLGGLEQKSITKNSSGLPLLARIPILKWLFARQLREKQNSKLNILIKPTVIY